MEANKIYNKAESLIACETYKQHDFADEGTKGRVFFTVLQRCPFSSVLLCPWKPP